jgi:hypothetical protein
MRGSQPPDRSDSKAGSSALPLHASILVRLQWAELALDSVRCLPSLEATHRVLRSENVVWMPGDGSPAGQVPLLLSTLAIAVMVFQLRVVTGTPKSRSNVPR